MPQLRNTDDIRKDVIETMGAKKISARRIMRDTGISHVTVAAFLKGKVETSKGTIIRLCLYLGLDWDCKEQAA